MTNRVTTRLVREGDYVAEVDVELIEEEDGWSPYLAVEAAYKLDDIRGALQEGDLRKASTLGRVYRLSPVEA